MNPLLPARFFPPVEQADEQGILGFGGQLTPEWLMDAYTHGIFPWPMFGKLVWCSPDPRAVLEFDDLHISRSLRRTLRRGQFTVSRDRSFRDVMVGCATAGDREESTWITPALIDAYTRLHALGFAHSIEVWVEDRLAGGLYGVAFGSLFAAESMFFRSSDASKVALVHLVDHLRQQEFSMLDIQVLNDHTAQLGGVEIRRVEYLERLARALARSASFVATGDTRNSTAHMAGDFSDAQ